MVRRVALIVVALTALCPLASAAATATQTLASMPTITSTTTSIISVISESRLGSPAVAQPLFFGVDVGPQPTQEVPLKFLVGATNVGALQYLYSHGIYYPFEPKPNGMIGLTAAAAAALRRAGISAEVQRIRVVGENQLGPYGSYHLFETETEIMPQPPSITVFPLPRECWTYCGSSALKLTSALGVKVDENCLTACEEKRYFQTPTPTPTPTPSPTPRATITPTPRPTATPAIRVAPFDEPSLPIAMFALQAGLFIAFGAWALKRE